MEKEKRIIRTDEEIKIFADPYRMRIIEVFIEQKKPLTVKDVADILGEVPAKVHYHVKKLLSIDILELDHIEVIHGINAKYYKLLHNSFRFEINKDDSAGMRALQVQGITKIVLNQMDRFKKDLFERTEKARDIEDLMDHDGFMTGNYIYLTEEEYLEFEKVILNFLEGKKAIDKSKNKYSIFFGMIAKE